MSRRLAWGRRPHAIARERDDGPGTLPGRTPHRWRIRQAVVGCELVSDDRAQLRHEEHPQWRGD